MSDWRRLKPREKCQVCEHVGWCGRSVDGTAVICMRIESDVPTRNGGWLHRLSDPLPSIPKRFKNDPPPRIDLCQIWRQAERQTDPHHLDGFAMSIGLDTEALRAIGCAWMERYQAWGFPMKDATGKLIGVRLRSESRKWAILGSRAGLFMP